MQEDDIYTKFGKLEFAVSKSIRYHEERSATLKNYLRWCQIFELCASCSTLIVLFAEWVTAAKIISGAAAIVSGLCLCSKFGSLIKLHTDLRIEFLSLLQKFNVPKTDIDEALYLKLKSAREEIEKQEPEILPVVNGECHNALCVARDQRDWIHPTSPWRKCLGRHIRINHE